MHAQTMDGKGRALSLLVLVQLPKPDPGIGWTVDLGLGGIENILKFLVAIL